MSGELEKDMNKAMTMIRRTGEDGGGLSHGRKQIDYTALADGYKHDFNCEVRWAKGVFYEYSPEDGYWRPHTQSQISARVADFLNGAPEVNGSPVIYNKNTEANVVGSLRGTKDVDTVPPVFLDTGARADSWAAMRNGILDMEAAARGDGKLLPFSQNVFSSRHFQFAWMPDAACPLFMRYLEEVQPEEDGREMLQLLAGMLLVPDTSYNVFFILYGDGGCGKSSFLNILSAMLGEDNVCSVTLSEMAEKHTAYRLTRALANLVDDSATVDGRSVSQSLTGAEGLLKRVTGGALIHCEPKGIDAWEAPAIARCVFCQNPPLPQFVDRSDGLWDRLRVIPFPVRFRGAEKQDPELSKKIIRSELPGVFAWAIRGLGKLRQYKIFPTCAAGKKLAEEHRMNCDIEKTFVLERYEVRSGVNLSSHDVYSDYRDWAEKRGYRFKNEGNFVGELLRVLPGVSGPMQIRGADGRKMRFVNLAKRDDVCEELEEQA